MSTGEIQPWTSHLKFQLPPRCLVNVYRGPCSLRPRARFMKPRTTPTDPAAYLQGKEGGSTAAAGEVEGGCVRQGDKRGIGETG